MTRVGVIRPEVVQHLGAAHIEHAVRRASCRTFRGPSFCRSFHNFQDHGVNNAEGGLRWPAELYRLNGSLADGKAAMGLLTDKLDQYQAQVQGTFCADEVFCGRDPERGTETCTVVETMVRLRALGLSVARVLNITHLSRALCCCRSSCSLSRFLCPSLSLAPLPSIACLLSHPLARSFSIWAFIHSNQVAPYSGLTSLGSIHLQNDLILLYFPPAVAVPCLPWMSLHASNSLQASYEHSFATLGVLELMDRVERLAFNALPAALTGDMWTHVYVQQANSVYAGVTHPNSTRGRRGHPHAHDAARAASKSCPRGACSADGGDGPSAFEEIQDVNYFGVSHFPCCITNFPQVRLMHTIDACNPMRGSPGGLFNRGPSKAPRRRSAARRGLTV